MDGCVRRQAFNLYGSTEVAWAAIATPEDLRDAPGTSGPPPPGTTIRILEDRNEVEQGETGEVFVVEEALEQHPAVAEVAVIAVEDEEFGERLKAFVVKDGDVSEDDLSSNAKENLADYKVPRVIEFIDELPRKPQGKVEKQQLKEAPSS